MAPPDNEPKALAVDLLNEIISYIKQSTPTRTTDTATQGFVYSQLRVGQMISPRDFGRPWNPIGGVAPAPVPAQPTGDATAPPGANVADAVRRGVQASMNTEAIVDTMLVVTNDGTLQTYSGGGRHLGFAYSSILQAMEAEPAPPRPPQDEERIAAARKVLWQEDGTATPLYARYTNNQLAYSKARADRVVNENRLLADPALAASAPLLLEPFQTAVDQARDRWRAQGADEVEAALATVQSLGVPLEQGAIADARALFDAWNLPLLGVPAKQPFSYVLPSDWAVLDIHDIGWTSLTIETRDYMNHFERHGFKVNAGNWAGEQHSTSGSAGVGIFGFGFNGSYSESESNSHSESTSSASDGTQFSNDARNLRIELEYGLCTIVRPWLVTDLFHLKNWFLKGHKAGAISSGKIDDQVGSEAPLLPLIPTHFLVIRNVKISAQHWNEDGKVLEKWNSKFTSDSSQHQSTLGGGVEVPVLGPICLDFGASHSASGYSGSFTDESGQSFTNDYKSHFNGTTLSIGGAQIVAWLSEVVPLCPPKDDPNLA
ncbi:MAG TPA: hypothetical protein VFX85_03050 [Solirubrobacterales bacterium]|nr:hypothetical protein [Solirubrobacterales bacterium]